MADKPSSPSSPVTSASEEELRQVAAEMRHFTRLLRSREVLPTMETMADRLTDWANELFATRRAPTEPGEGRCRKCIPGMFICPDCQRGTSPTPTPDPAALLRALKELIEGAKHASMEWRLHGQLTDSCRVLERATRQAEAALTSVESKP